MTKRNLLRTLMFMLLASWTLSSCKKDPEQAHVQFNRDASFSIPTTTAKTTLNIGPVTTKISLDSLKQANGIDGVEVQSLNVQDAKVSITVPKGQNFDVFNNMTVYISSQGVTEQKLAYVSSIDKGVTSLELKVIGVDLQPFFATGSITLRAVAGTNDAITNPMTQNIKFQYLLVTK